MSNEQSIHVDFKIREVNGFNDLENSVIKCADCGKKLLKVLKVKESDEEKIIQSKCICGGTSFKVRLKGVYYFDSADNLCISNIEDNLFIMMEKKQ